MSHANSERRLAAILCADMVGYSSRMHSDETGTLLLLNQVREELFEPLVFKYRGRIFKLLGDGFLVEFPSVADGVECALDFQREVRSRNEKLNPDDGLKFRVGINSGDVIVQDGDVYGDGVNVAARLESIARPGGIALSEAAFRQVMGKVVAVFEDTGFQTLKNITEPVQVFHWPRGASAENSKNIQAGTGLAPPIHPTLLVLPFENSSGNPDFDLFAEGIAEDVIYGVSRFSGFDVIGRFSAFSEKTRQMTLHEFQNDLGVRYVVTGDVRRGAGRVRISVEMTDCSNGVQLWSRRFDRDLGDIFAIEDEISEEIVAALPGQILRAEKERVRRKPPKDMTAYDHVIAGRILHHKVLPEDNREAVSHLEKAIQLDPDYADAYAWKACTLGQSLEFGFVSDSKAVEDEAISMINKALTINEEHLECHRLLCEVHIMFGQMEQAERHNERALSMNSCDPRLLAQKGEVLTWQGKPKEGLEWIQKAMNLDPFGAPGRAHLLGRALHSARRYQDALNAYDLISAPNQRFLAEIAACHAHNGNRTRALEMVQEVLGQNPKFSVQSFASSLHFENAADVQHISEGLSLAGFPD